MLRRTSSAAPYEYVVAGRALARETQSGDAALVHPTATGVLVAVADGLGHGDEAAAAAGAAIQTLRDFAGEPLTALLRRCHEALLPTRGAALALAALDAAHDTLTWLGVGNVEAVLIATRAHRRATLCLTNRGGVVGYRLPALTASVAPLFPGDVLILATDGIDGRFVAETDPHDDADRLAHGILDRHAKATDDALVLVLRWFGHAGGKGHVP